MKYIKKYSYIIIMILTGVCYLSFTDSWDIYTEPVRQIKSWYAGWQGVQGNGDAADDGSVSGNTVSGNGSDGGILRDNTVSGTDCSQSGENPASGSLTVPGAGNQTGTKQPETQDPEIQLPETTRSPDEVQYSTVDDSYFSDAVFIGDSRTVGMFEYGGLEQISNFYASTGLTVYKLFDTPIVSVPGQKEKQTIEQALTEKQFAKIYLMIGINEMGTGTVETFAEKYSEVVEHLKELQPDAIIYIQGIIKVTAERSGKGDYIHNEGIEARNREIEKLADNIKVYYLDVNPLICDETGGMIPDYTFDGVHLKAQYIPIWKEYLKSKAVLLD